MNSTKKGYNSCIKQLREYYVTELGRRDIALPVREGDIIGFFGWLVDTKFKDKPASPSTVRHYKSALLWYHGEHKQYLDPHIDREIELLLKGYQRRVADLKAAGKMSVFEGKYHLPYDGYCLVARALFVCTSFNQMLFGWPFLILQWNLIARSATVAGIMMEHVGWEGDALLITTPKHKADQEGAHCFSRHLYANPGNPVLCPVLALAIVVFTHAIKHDSSQPADSTVPPSFRIFDGGRSETRFSEALGRAIDGLSESDLTRLGGEKKQIGTHSVRKGAASYCAGMVNGPSPVQIYLRAGWTLGGVQNRYLFAGAGGDQLTGRVLSGLPFNDSTFAALPPHFDAEGLVLIQWTVILPLYTRLPETFKRALPYLLASICYHEDWLRAALSARHPLFATHLFASGTVATLKTHITTGRNRCASTGMLATGIPPHLVLSNDMTDVAKQTVQLKDEILNKCKELPAELVTVLMNRFSINGALPVTLDDMQRMLGTVITQMRAELRDALPIATSQPTALSAPLDTDADSRFQLWMWKGALHMVPEGWQFPSTNVKATWHLWHFGHVQDRVRPLRRLRKADMQGSANHTLWSKTNGVMRRIADEMVTMEMVHTAEEVTRWSADESAVAFDGAIVQLMEKLKAGSTQRRGRWTEMSVATLYKHLKGERDDKKRRRDEVVGARSEGVDSEAVEDEAAGESEPALQRRRAE